MTLENTGALKPGDRLVITRPSTAEWIAALHMRGFPGTYANQRLDWAPGSRNPIWDRTVTQVDAAAKQITVDAPLTTALERRYGAGTVARVAANPALARIGITSAWYFSSSVLMIGVILALAVWGFRTATAGKRLWRANLLD